MNKNPPIGLTVPDQDLELVVAVQEDEPSISLYIVDPNRG